MDVRESSKKYNILQFAIVAQPWLVFDINKNNPLLITESGQEQGGRYAHATCLCEHENFM